MSASKPMTRAWGAARARRGGLVCRVRRAVRGTTIAGAWMCWRRRSSRLLRRWWDAAVVVLTPIVQRGFEGQWRSAMDGKMRTKLVVCQ
jgi:hypothetical protein